MAVTARSTALPATLRDARSMCAALLTTARSHPEQVALRTPDDSVELTYAQALERVGAIASGLRALGVGHGDSVGLMLVNRPEFHLVDAAATLLRAIPFSVYNTLPPEQVGYVMGDAGNRVVVTEMRFLDVVRAARGHGAPYEHIVLVDGNAADCVSLGDLEGRGGAFDVDAAVHSVSGDDVLTLIYTSGTTGPPKGVEITHANMLAELRGLHLAVPIESGGRQVSFLPSAHIADRWGSHYSAFMAYANTLTTVADLPQLMSVVAQVRPTVFGAVPRVWEKVKAALEASFEGDLAAAARANPEVGAGVRAKLGLDQAQWFATGAAPSPVDMLEFFDALGIRICEVWGMSETSCIVTTNRPDALRYGSVGLPLDQMELQLADDGELLVRGPLVMRRYRNMPERTAETIDSDGWLHSGDIARIDEDGFVWIVDRKKELIINAAGKNMSPANIEMQLKSAGPLIGQACVIGDRRPYNVALLVLDPDAAAGLDATDSEVIVRVADEVERANEHLARVEQIKRFRLLDSEWLPGRDELTPTMKLKRRAIAEKYAAEIDALYAG